MRTWVLCAVCVAVGVPASADDLAAAAAKEELRRAKARQTSTSKVISKQDLGTVGKDVSFPGGQTGSERPLADPSEPALQPVAGAAAPTTDGVSGNQASQLIQRIKAIQVRVETARAELAAAERNMHFNTTHTLQTFSLDYARRRLAATQNKLDLEMKLLAELEDQARRVGVLPGQLR